MITAIIKLTTAGADSGPTFNLLSNASVPPYSVAFEAGITKAQLTAASGFPSDKLPNGTTIVRIASIGACTNFIDITI